MNTATLAGIILIVIGVIALALQGISYTRQETTEIGPIAIGVERRETIPLPPILGAIALVGGIVLVIVGSRGGKP